LVSLKISSIGTISGGVLTIRGYPSTRVVSLDSACRLSRARDLSSVFRTRLRVEESRTSRYSFNWAAASMWDYQAASSPRSAW